MKRKSGSSDRKKEPSSTIGKDTPLRQKKDNFPVVGIGASAGGLEALEQFLSHVSAQSGIAFVIVQHLSPTHKGILPELLQRATPAKVIQVKDRIKVKPDHIYVIPPNSDMSILHGVLHLFEPSAPRGLRLPIDFFFRTLADDLKEKSVGVILSGMGTDGTMGLRAIKEKGGLVLVQEPASAKFDSMPRSSIDAGLADIIAPAEELPEKIVAYFSNIPTVRPGISIESKAQSALEKIIILLRANSGHDFSSYKKTTLYRRIERRMGIHQINKVSSYVRFLRENPQELELLFKEFLIGVTSFFRDPDAWKRLKEGAIPALFAGRPAGKPLKTWVVGCSTGEEAYSLAIILKEALEEIKPAQRFPIQIFATDLSQDAINKARQGRYLNNIVSDVSTDRLDRFFLKEKQDYLINKEIREMVMFAQQNVVMNPPFTKLDILLCRNLLIYLEQAIQKKLIPLFHYSLNSGGILFLGNAETISTFTDLFSPLYPESRIYKRLAPTVRVEPIESPSSFVQTTTGNMHEQELLKPSANLQALADQLILQWFSPVAVLTNDKGDILYINGRTGNYLEPAAGKANWNIFVMAREGLRYELEDAYRKAFLQAEEVNIPGLKIKVNGSNQTVDISVSMPSKNPKGCVVRC